MPDPLRAKNFDRAARKLDLMHELGARLLCVCSNVSPDAIDDRERAARDLAELADLARQQGMRIGYEALAWGRWVKDWTARLGHRARRRPGQSRDCARQLSYLRPRQSDRADRRSAGREDRARAGRRRAGAGHGPAVAEPALSLLSRPGRLSDRRLSRRRDPLRLPRPAVARNLQRPVSRRFRRGDRDRRHALAARRGRSAGGEDAPRAATRRSPTCRRFRRRQWSSAPNSSSSRSTTRPRAI